mmetsp:Transcript_34029/g.81661  ORF Transcript_34029/g.81661 Transcript_34029/m.81661 type:complete len:250 (-) Transcript_34029:1184-1933(-)
MATTSSARRDTVSPSVGITTRKKWLLPTRSRSPVCRVWGPSSQVPFTKTMPWPFLKSDRRLRMGLPGSLTAVGSTGSGSTGITSKPLTLQWSRHISASTPKPSTEISQPSLPMRNCSPGAMAHVRRPDSKGSTDTLTIDTQPSQTSGKRRPSCRKVRRRSRSALLARSCTSSALRPNSSCRYCSHRSCTSRDLAWAWSKPPCASLRFSMLTSVRSDWTMSPCSSSFFTPCVLIFRTWEAKCRVAPVSSS